MQGGKRLGEIAMLGTLSGEAIPKLLFRLRSGQGLRLPPG